jgi:hypothetical protein
MATQGEQSLHPAASDESLFLRGAVVMTFVIVAGFSLQLAMGRSTFAAPLAVHAHAIIFMGWVGIYLAQNVFVATGRMHLHRRLGYVAAAWVVPMVVLGYVVTVEMVRRGHVPFFFRPLQFLVFDILGVITFAGLTAAAIVMRRRTQWHRRLHFCAMAVLTTPAFGRLLPMPLLQPWAWEAAFMVTMIFPVAGAWVDLRRHGRVHPAWYWGIATMFAAFVLTELVTYSAVGVSIYQVVTEGSPGAAVPPLHFAAPPAGSLVTGRG